MSESNKKSGSIAVVAIVLLLVVSIMCVIFTKCTTSCKQKKLEKIRSNTSTEFVDVK